MEKSISNWAMSELSKHSDTPVSTIKFYIRKGLLPKPVKTGKTKGYYSANHLNRLVLIKKLQQDEKMSLNKISEIIKLVGDVEGNGQVNNSGGWLNRSLIIEKAIKLFREKGYEKATIADIANVAQIGIGTFYKYFKSKKDLFLECLKAVIQDENMKMDAIDFTNKDEGVETFLEITQTYAKEYLVWRDMISMLRVAAISSPAEFADTLKEAMQMKLDFFKKHLDRGVRVGLFRKVNLTVLAIIFLGMQELSSEYLTEFRSDASDQKTFDAFHDIIFNGILEK